MTQKRPDYLSLNISKYVPDMTYAADVLSNANNIISLGTPSAASTTAIASAVAITSAVDNSVAVTTDAKYGRNVQATVSASGTPAVSVYGLDYLGQPMMETLTANGTAVIAGVKMFKKVLRYTSAALSGQTVSIGWYTKLGLPYKAKALVRAYEGSLEVLAQPSFNRQVVTGVDTAGTGVATLTAEFAGYVAGWSGLHTTAMTTNPSVMTAAINSVAKTAYDGLAPIAVAGLQFGKDVDQESWEKIGAGQTLTLTSGGEGTAGVSNFTAYFVKAFGQFTAGASTTVSATTADTRGSYIPYTTPDGATEISVELQLDDTNLHGVAHYYA